MEKFKSWINTIFLCLSVFGTLIVFGVRLVDTYQSNYTVTGTIVESIPSFKKSVYTYQFKLAEKTYYYKNEVTFFIPKNGVQHTLYLKVKNQKIVNVVISTLSTIEGICLALVALFLAFYLIQRKKLMHGLCVLLILLGGGEILSLMDKYYTLRFAQFADGITTKEGTLDYSPEVEFTYNQHTYLISAKKLSRKKGKHAAFTDLAASVYNKMHNQLGQVKRIIFIKPSEAVIYDYKEFWMLDLVVSFLFFVLIYCAWKNKKKTELDSNFKSN